MTWWDGIGTRNDMLRPEFRAMKMQPSLERALGRKGIVGA